MRFNQIKVTPEEDTIELIGEEGEIFSFSLNPHKNVEILFFSDPGNALKPSFKAEAQPSIITQLANGLQALLKS